MAEGNPDGPIIQFDNLNWLGKVVFIGGAVSRVASKLVDSAIDSATTLIADTERAFKEGIDPNVEDAKIIEERDEPKK